MIDMTRVKRLNKLLTDQATAIYLPIVHLNKSVDRNLSMMISFSFNFSFVSHSLYLVFLFALLKNSDINA